MAKVPAQFYKDHSGGMVSSLNESLGLPNVVKTAINVDFDVELGSAVTRPGSALVGSQLVAGQSVLGLHDFRDSDGSNHALLAAVGTAVYKVGTGTITTGLTAGKKMRFVSFLDSVLMMNGTNATRSYNGATVITTGGVFDLANIPFAEPTIGLEWLDRVYLIGDSSNPDRLYYSSTPVGGEISWTLGNGFIDVEPEDGGGGLTGIGKIPGFLLIFKERSMKRWNFDSAFPETLIDLGTPSHESIINAGGMCAFFSASDRDTTGFYITNGGRPTPISHDRLRNIKSWVDAIPQSAHANIAGIGNSRWFKWSVGDLTVDGVEYSNVVLKYNHVLDQWSVHSYPSEFKVFSTYVDGDGNNTVVGGDDDGNVIETIKPGTYVDIDDTPIRYAVTYHDENFGYNQLKSLGKSAVVVSEGMPGALLRIKPDAYEHKDFPEVSGRVSEIPFGESVKGNFFSFGIHGTVDGQRGYLKEIEIPDINIKDNYGSN